MHCKTLSIEAQEALREAEKSDTDAREKGEREERGDNHRNDAPFACTLEDAFRMMGQT